MTETGEVARGTTQIGEVKRPLAAVSRITKANNFVFFSDGADYIIDRRDELAESILQLVKKAQKKTKLYQHKGTYRMRAWLIPDSHSSQGAASPFGRQGI